MATDGMAVFLSYASEDAEAAQRIADALRAAGVEVWFDRSELRGGDAWDRNIRDQIHQCRLFLPIISAHSEARDEGYFRREWALAEDRTRDMAHNRAFLIPIAVDGTPERGALVPEKFLNVQWTRLPGGKPDAAFVERVKRLIMAEVAPSQPPVSSGGDRVVRATPLRVPRRRWFVGAAGAVALAVLVVAYVAYGRRGERVPDAQTANSIAVLPLANESGDPSQQYFSDGLSENLITALTQFPGLKVIGRTSAFQFRDSKEDAHSIGAKLGVARLLEGSVQRAGETVRVSAELIDTADGSTQWSERYDRPFKDLFALQDDITHAVAGALRAKLLAGEHASAQDERPANGSIEAYSAMLQGQFYYERESDADNRKAVDYFTQATQIDPRYGLAWSRLSRAWVNVGDSFFTSAGEQQAAYAKAREAAGRALTLSPNLAAAHIAQGNLLQSVDFNWAEAEGEFRRALELAPNDAEAKYFLGGQLSIFGELDESLELTRQAIAVEPIRAKYYQWTAIYLLGLNRVDEAEQASHRAIALNPTGYAYHLTLATIEVQRGNVAAALDAAQLESPGPMHDSAVALARQIGSDPTAADAALQSLVEKYAGAAPFEIARNYALRGDGGKMFEWLDRARTTRDAGIENLLADPFILRFKHDPRFAAFCRKVGLPVPGERRAGSND